MKHRQPVFFFFIAISFASSFLLARAQSDSLGTSSFTDPTIPPARDTATTSSALPMAVPVIPPSPPRPAPVPPSPVPATSTTPIVPTLSTANTPTPQDPNFLVAGLIALFILGTGVLGLKTIIQNNNKKTKGTEDQRCDDIQSLLEQKKKELAEMVRNWPEEKAKEIASGIVLEGLKKDEGLKNIIETVGSAKDTYDKLQEMIVMLQKRYDFCRLSFPASSTTPYQGTIVENSLNDKTILKYLDIKKSYTAGDWSLNDVLVNEKQIEKLGEYLHDGPWYMHFWQPNKDDVIVVFKDKSFKIKHSDRATWGEAVEHGRSKGISQEQLDFRTQRG